MFKMYSNPSATGWLGWFENGTGESTLLQQAEQHQAREATQAPTDGIGACHGEHE